MSSVTIAIFQGLKIYMLAAVISLGIAAIIKTIVYALTREAPAPPPAPPTEPK